MAIKMRNNNDLDAECYECGDKQKDVINMFDICIAGEVFTVCDRCNEKLLNKCIKAHCFKNGRLKTPQDMAVMRRRKNEQYK